MSTNATSMIASTLSLTETTLRKTYTQTAGNDFLSIAPEGTARIADTIVHQGDGNDRVLLNASQERADGVQGITLDGGAGNDTLDLGLRAPQFSQATITREKNGSFTLDGLGINLNFQNYETIKLQAMGAGLPAQSVTLEEIQQATQNTPTVTLGHLLGR